MSQPPPSSPSPPGGGGPPQPQNSRWTHPLVIAVAGPLVAGIFTVVAVYLGQSKGALPIPSGPSPAAEPSTAVGPSSAAGDTAAGSPTSSRASTGPSAGTSAPTAGSPAVRHQGEVTIADVASGGDSIDINAPADDPIWRAGDIGAYDAGAVMLNSGNLYIEAASILMLNSGEAAAYEACRTRTGYVSASGIDPSTLEDSNVCIRTDEGRFATVRLVDSGEDSVTLAITTWQMR